MDTGYSTATTPVSGPASSASDAGEGEGQYWPLGRCKKSYLDYLFNKTQEIEEQKNARRYYHGVQWTSEQIKALGKRKQPVVTFNRVGRKIDGVVGLIERLRQDPKAYARTPQHDQGAELATAVLRYVLDEEEWKAKSPEVARKAAIDGLAGVEMLITKGDEGDPEVSFDIVEPDSFFYDPRCYRSDFSDAIYMGVGKWMELDQAIEMFPDKADDLKSIGSYSSELSSNPDREKRWFTEVGSKRLVRLVEVWYRWKGKWCWTIFTGYSILMEGESYFIDNKGETFCKYIMFSCNVDQDGDRYGFIRNMKSAQDEYNHRRSKALHQINSRRLIISQGAVADIEKARREWARPDGVIAVPTNDVTQAVKADDQSFDFAGQLKLMENAVSELDNYGPNQALIGDQTNQSGRAIALLQQAGMAELGPYILGYRGWKLRLYRAIWNIVQKYWTGERWIRVTDDQSVKNFVAINQQGQDQFGQPVVANPIGSLDVDIIIDEGPDAINMQADSYDTLTVLASKGANIPPQVLIELSPLSDSVKKRILGYFEQPDPAKQLAMAGEKAKVDETNSRAALNMAKVRDLGTPEQPNQGDGVHPDLKNMKAAADIEDTRAGAAQKAANARKTNIEAALVPAQAAHDALIDRASLAVNAFSASQRPDNERAEQES
ncbi:MAG: hypothetical protein EKK40_07080 [Bradyrhizobiaceae bacterium]|nr:MAG: hypothetical protein EKK40_07080 [Bradyrhizobiaceae bacterium]